MATSKRTQIRRQLNAAIRELERVDQEVRVFGNEALDLVGSTEAAEILGIAAQAVHNRVHRGTFPEPIVTLACGPIWHRSDIEVLAG
jgi:hypothetical protein